MAFVRHGTLVAGQVASVEVPGLLSNSVEVMNRGSDPIFFIVSKNPAEQPTVNGDDNEIVMPGSSLVLRVASGSLVKMVSSGTPAYSVRVG